MALSSDQQAILQLLLERGQAYSDLARVLGTDEAGVRERARRALEEIVGSDPDANVALTDFLLGQADPIDRADVVRRLRETPDDQRLASDLATRLRELYPEARLPRLPGEQRPSRLPRLRRGVSAPGPPATEPAGLRLPGRGLSAQQTRLLAVLAGAAVILVAIVLGVTGAFGGGDEGEPAPAATETTATTATEPGEELAVIELAPTSGGNATAEVRIGVATAGQAYADLAVEGLEPPGADDAYVLWLLLNERTGYPLSPVNMPANGRLSERYAIPTAVTAVASRTRFVDISLTSRRELQREVLDAAEQGNPVVPYTGESVLRGAIRGGGAAPSG